MSRRYTDAYRGPGLTLTALQVDEQQQLAKQFGAANAQELTRKLADPAFLRPMISALPPLCWLALDTLIEANGVLSGSEWERLIALSCTGVPNTAIQRAINRVATTGLLIAQSGPRERWSSLALIAECYDAVSALVAGVTLPSAEPPSSALEARAPAAARATSSHCAPSPRIANCGARSRACLIAPPSSG